MSKRRYVDVSIGSNKSCDACGKVVPTAAWIGSRKRVRFAWLCPDCVMDLANCILTPSHVAMSRERARRLVALAEAYDTAPMVVEEDAIVISGAEAVRKLTDAVNAICEPDYAPIRPAYEVRVAPEG